jgi:hypothetical protein
MNTEEILKKLNEIIDEEARTSVGILCKRIEILKENGVLTPELFKGIAKETVYENSRTLKKIISYLLVPSITFK